MNVKEIFQLAAALQLQRQNYVGTDQEAFWIGLECVPAGDKFPRYFHAPFKIFNIYACIAIGNTTPSPANNMKRALNNAFEDQDYGDTGAWSWLDGTPWNDDYVMFLYS